MNPCLPGTALKQLLSWFKLQDEAGCQCASRARIMDAWGCDETERRMDEVVGWLREAAAARGLPFIDFAARAAVKLAIWRARNGSSLPDQRAEVALEVLDAQGRSGGLDGVQQAQGADPLEAPPASET